MPVLLVCVLHFHEYFVLFSCSCGKISLFSIMPSQKLLVSLSFLFRLSDTAKLNVRATKVLEGFRIFVSISDVFKHPLAGKHIYSIVLHEKTSLLSCKF